MRISYWSSDVCSSDLTDGMAEAVAAVLVLEADIRGLGETGAQIVRRPRLQRLAVLHHRFDRIGRDGAGKTLIIGLFAGDHVQRQRLERTSGVSGQNMAVRNASDGRR